MDEVSNSSSSSSEQAQINRIKHITYCSKEAMIQMSAIDALGTYGKPAIDTINELINCSSIDRKVKAHAKSVIKSIELTS